MADPKKKLYTQVINVPCSVTDKAMAQQLAKETGLTMSHILRRAIKNLHQMTFTNQPNCATGAACMCPGMHHVRQAGQKTDEEAVIAAQRQLESEVTQ